jgi:hypothetical protein
MIGMPGAFIKIRIKCLYKFNIPVQCLKCNHKEIEQKRFISRTFPHIYWAASEIRLERADDL